MKEYIVKPVLETLDMMLANQCSVARFGEAELRLIAGHDAPLQEYDERLASDLRELLGQESTEQLLVCLPDVFDGKARFAPVANVSESHVERYASFYEEFAGATWYGSSFVSRPYSSSVDKSQGLALVEQLKAIWKDQDVLVVEGATTRSGLGNDLFDGVNSLSRIVCPAKNAYAHYEDIAEAIRQHGQNKLVILMLGPTATVLAYRLSQEGFWTLDLGHLDSEYEWLLAEGDKPIKLTNKHTAGYDDTDLVFDNLLTYDKQVVDFFPKPLVSIVVPIYNVEQYLEQCVNSLTAQTYTNIEIILVNDGSTDGSGEICQRLATTDTRIKVIEKENGGLSDARNVGLEASVGAYVTFIDSDDFVTDTYVQRLCQGALIHGARIVVGEHYRLSDGMFYFHSGDLHLEEMTPTTYLDKIFAAETVTFVTAWGKLFDRTLFDGDYPIRFPVGYVAEDKFVTYLLAWKTDKVLYLREPLYCYRHREGSITSSGVSLSRASNDIEACETRIADLILTGYDLTRAVHWYQYILLVHEEYLRYAGLTDNPLYQKIKKKIALFKHEYR